MSRDFFNICHEQYMQEMSESQHIYQKAGIMLVVIPLLATVVVKLARLDVLSIGIRACGCLLVLLVWHGGMAHAGCEHVIRLFGSAPSHVQNPGEHGRVEQMAG